MRAANALAEGFPKLIAPVDISKVKMTTKKDHGYMVHYDVRDRHVIAGNLFPDSRDGDAIFADYSEACKIAELFAKCTIGYASNIYVIDHKFCPCGSGTWNHDSQSAGKKNS